jgi:hypothetical protein
MQSGLALLPCLLSLHVLAPRLLALPVCLPAAGKDVMQRVGSKGPAAELVRVLVCRLTPNLLQPEVLHAAMEEAEQSQEGGSRGSCYSTACRDSHMGWQ